MDGKANVKSIMAKFNNNSADDVHCHQVKAEGQTPLLKNTAFELFAKLENASPPARPSNIYKPASVKLPLSTKPLHEASDKDLKAPPLKDNLVANKVKLMAQAASREANERPGFPKPLGPKPSEGLREEVKPAFLKPLENRQTVSPAQKNGLKLPEQRLLQTEPQGTEVKPVFPKIAGVKEKFTNVAQESNPKPPFTKPPISQKPSQFTQSEEKWNKNAFLNQALSGSIGLKPKPSSLRVVRNAEEKSRSEHSLISPALKTADNQSNLPQIFPKPAGQQNEAAKPRDIKNILKQIQEESGSASSAPAAKVASSFGAITVGPWGNHADKEENDKNVPKRKTLPSPFTLGPAPQKPSRPPTVDLKKFKKDHGESSNHPPSVGLPPPLPPPISTTQSSLSPPPPPAFHPSTQTPVLPPRMKIKPRCQENEENYDDVEFGSEGAGNADESQNSDGEMYEDINNMRTAPQEDDKKKEKEEKKKKENKEKDKKEQELRKKFKLMGPIEVIHQARACTDFKGGKNDLSFRQGDQLEILRITGNPEGKWLGRIKGSYGYIKTTMVEIDYDSLRRKPRTPINTQPKHPDSDQEMYDDIGDQDSISSGNQSNREGFPVPPPFVDIYDGLEDEGDGPAKSVSQDEERNDTWSKGLWKILKGKDYPKKSVRGTGPSVNATEDNEGFLRTPSDKQTGKDSEDSDVYDDVESTDFPPPPKEISLGINIKALGFGRGRSDERDSQKIKKIDKEEKEFRKKFKYEGDIRVLYTTTISSAPSPKKRGCKDLQVKPGEVIEVIKNVDDTKVLCRNEEGKYGYVQRSCIADEDEEIYDDIADGCLYDND